jgi:hypothetical protein
MKYILIFIIFFLSLTKSNAQVLDWVYSLGNAKDDTGFNCMKMDSSGNQYLAGIFEGIFDFDPGVNEYFLEAAYNSYSLYVLKLDSEGNFLWVKKIDKVSIVSMDVDKSGNIILIGGYSQTVDFDPGPNVYNMTSVNNKYILKLDNNGNFLWGLQGQDLKMEQCKFDNNGNIYISGGFAFSVIHDADPGSDTFILSDDLGENFYISKLDLNGNFINAICFGRCNQVDEDEDMNSFIIDDNGNIYITGSFDETVDFDPGPNTYNLSNPAGSYETGGDQGDIFIAKYNENMELIWAKRVGGNNYDEGVDIKINKSGKLYSWNFALIFKHRFYEQYLSNGHVYGS